MFMDKKSWCIRVQFQSFLCSKLATIVGKLMLMVQNWEIFPWFLRPPEVGSGLECRKEHVHRLVYKELVDWLDNWIFLQKIFCLPSTIIFTCFATITNEWFVASLQIFCRTKKLAKLTRWKDKIILINYYKWQHLKNVRLMFQQVHFGKGEK